MANVKSRSFVPQDDGLRVIAVITATCVAMGFLSGCQNAANQPAGAQTPVPAVAVQTTKPETKDVARVITLPGDVLPWQEATIYAKVPGYLDRLLADKGDHVKAGQLLAVIRAPELGAEANQAQQAYLSAQAAAQVNRTATRKAFEETVKARVNAEKAKADAAQAPASVARARALQQQAQATLQKSIQQKAQAQTAADEARSQVAKAEADVQSAAADQQLADVTFERYNGIYAKDHRLIAKQQVDEAESRSKAAAGKVAAARSQVETARQRVRSAEAQIGVSDQQIEEARAGVQAAQRQIDIAQAQGVSLQKQAEAANRDIAISKSQQEVAEEQARQAQLLAKANQAAESRLSTVADYANLRAPFSGTVTKRLVDPGAFIQTAATSQNAAAVLTVADVDRLRLDIHIPESEARYVQPGTTVELTSISLGDETIKAKVTRTSGALDAKSRTLLAEVELPNQDHKLLPGAYITARITLETHPSVLALPSAAIGADKSGKFVFVVSGGKAKRVPVTVGFDNGALAEVQEGLRGGEEVVVTGRDNLTPGAAVTTSQWVPKKKKDAK